MKRDSLTTQNLKLKGKLSAGEDIISNDLKKILNKVKGRQKVIDLDGGLSPEGEYLAEKGHDVVVVEEDGLINMYRPNLFPDSKAAILNVNVATINVDFQYFDYAIIRQGLPSWYKRFAKNIIDLREMQIVKLQEEPDVLSDESEYTKPKTFTDLTDLPQCT
jgi:hypothetical protein